MRINNSLTISNRMPSGYEYRVREQDDGKAILIAEGRALSGPSTKRQLCDSAREAMKLAGEWEAS